MSTYILTSMFPNGLNEKCAEVFRQKIRNRGKFAFVASEFEKIHEKTDSYFDFFCKMFEDAGIWFEEAYVVDGRMSPQQAQEAVAKADVVWLSGGDTPTQFAYFQKYGLDKILKKHEGVLIGMSAGTINLTKTAVCTLSCGHFKQEVYEALGCVDISVEPHFVKREVSDEVLAISKDYPLYGLCDDAMIVCEGDSKEYYGEIYLIRDGEMEVVSAM